MSIQQLFSSDLLSATTTGTCTVSARQGNGLYDTFHGLKDNISDGGYSAIQYAWYLANGTANAWNSGFGLGSHGGYNTSDVFAVSYVGTTVSWLKNDVVVRTLETTEGRSFYFYCVLYQSGASITNIQCGTSTLVSSSANLTISGDVVSKVSADSWDSDNVHSSTVVLDG